MRKTDQIDRRDDRLAVAWIERADRPSPRAHHEPMDRRSAQVVREGLEDLVCEALTGPGDTVCLGAFLVEGPRLERALLDAARRKRVYLLVAAESELERAVDDDDQRGQERIEGCRLLLRKLAGHVFVRTGRHLHAKFILNDIHRPERTNGWLLTANLTSLALTERDELAVRFDPDEAAAVRQIARWVIWEGTDHQLLDPRALAQTRPIGLVSPPAQGLVPATVAETRTLRTEVLRAIDAGGHAPLTVSSYGWHVEHEAVRALVRAAEADREVTVLARPRPGRATFEALATLRRAGARVLGVGGIHAKTIWSEHTPSLVMTANLEAKGLDEGFELGVRAEPGTARHTELGTHLAAWTQSAGWELRVDLGVGEVPSGAAVRLDTTERPWPRQTMLARASHDFGSRPRGFDPRSPRVRAELPLAHVVDVSWDEHGGDA